MINKLKVNEQLIQFCIFEVFKWKTWLQKQALNENDKENEISLIP